MEGSSKLDIQQNRKFKSLEFNFDPNLVSKIVGIKVKSNQIYKILTKLGFTLKKKGKNFVVKVPTWRPDIFAEIDLVEEVIRIMGLETLNQLSRKEKN